MIDGLTHCKILKYIIRGGGKKNRGDFLQIRINFSEGLYILLIIVDNDLRRSIKICECICVSLSKSVRV